MLNEIIQKISIDNPNASQLTTQSSIAYFAGSQKVFLLDRFFTQRRM